MLRTSQLISFASLITVTFSVAFMLAVLLLPPTIAQAATTCDNIDTSIVSCDSDENGVWALLLLIINILSAGVGIVAVGGIVYASFLWVTAEDKQDQISQAKSIITNVVVGIVLFALTWTGLQFIVPGGVFDREYKFSSVKNSTGSLPSTSDTKSASNSASRKNTSAAKKTAATACYWNPKGSKPSGNLYHRSGSVPYAFENSPQGVRYAAKNGYDRIDIDLLITKDGVIVATHTQDPMRSDPVFGGFSDPKKKLSKKKKINEMNWDQVSRLVHKDGYRIHKADDIVKAAKQAGVQIQFELKASGRWQSKLPELAAILNENKAKANIAIQTNKPKWKNTLDRANDLGFWARNISSGTWLAPKPDPSLCKKLGSQ